MQADQDSPTGKWDWRILLGLLLTFLWLLLGSIYISINVGWHNFTTLPMSEMGTFLEGAFAPLAFLWLVIGLFIQQTILAENNQELRHNNRHSERQTQAIAATELNARQETFFKIADNTRRQLGGIAGMLYVSSQGPAGDGPHSADEINDLWKQFASGDVEVFSRRFLTIAFNPDVDMKDLLYGTAIRRRHSDNFIVGMDRLLRLARECDTENIIQDALIHSAHGLLNNRMRELHPEIRFTALQITNAQDYLRQIVG
ncbi:MAG: hypothetical protein RLZZ385_800 [Pseudomonadota bacterium]|jgi:hypothetical protein